jgi:hypothetical protein
MRTGLAKALASPVASFMLLAAAAATAHATTYTIGGTVSGLLKGNSVVLENGKSTATINANGAAIYFTKLAGGTKYDVAVKTEPKGQNCTVKNGLGTIAKADVTDVNVTCTTNTYTIGGTVSGLLKGGSVTLEDNGKKPLKVTANGTFTFTKAPLAYEASYDVTVETQPTGQSCKVTDGIGKVPAKDVTTVVVACTANDYKIVGTLSGLSPGASVTLENNGKNPLPPLTKNGPFEFTAAYDSSYKLTISAESAGEDCVFTKGASGTVPAANVTGVTVACTPLTFSISGSVTGLTSTANSVTIENGTATQTPTLASPTFQFTGIAYGSSYAVTVVTQPTGETCSVSANGSGASITANVTGVTVACTPSSPTTYSISGTVTGLTSSGGSVTLTNESGTPTTVTFPASTFQFSNLSNGSAYDIAVSVQPTGETCSVTGGGPSTIMSANVTGVVVACTSSGTGPGSGSYWIPFDAQVISFYTIGGMVSGLTSGQSVTLLNSSDADSVTVTANGAFTFPYPEANGAAYSVTVGTQPSGQTCSVTGGSASVMAANVTSIMVSCSAGSGGGAAPRFPAGIQPMSMTRNIPGRPFNLAASKVSNIFASPLDGSPTAGLFLIASNTLESNPAPMPTWITTTPVTIVDEVPQITLTGNAISSYTPDLVSYYQVQSDGSTQFYGLNISDTSSTPAPTAFGAAIPNTQQVCTVYPLLTDLTNPASELLVIAVATGSPGICDSYPAPTITYETLPYGVSTSTPPATLAINGAPLTVLYTDNDLDAMLVTDQTNNALDFYPYSDETFGTPKQIITGVCSAVWVGDATLADGAFGDTVDYLDVTAESSTTTPPSCTFPSGPTTLYRVDTTSGGTAKQIFANPGSSLVTDDTNVYFIYTTTAGTQGTIYQQPISGVSDPMELYTTTLTFDPTSEEQALSLIGSNDSTLVYTLMTEPLTSMGIPETNLITTDVNTIPVGTLSTAPSTLASNLAGGATGFLVPASGTTRSSDVLFVNVSNVLIQVNPTTFSHTETAAYSSTAGPLTGTLPTPAKNTVYDDLGARASLGLASGESNNTVLQIRNITETDGGDGGGNIFQVDVGTLVGTEMTTTGGGDYQIPAEYVGFLTAGFSENIAVGDLFPEPSLEGTSTTPEFGLAGDLIKNFVLQVGVTDSNVNVF